jgi:hypothetical protein
LNFENDVKPGKILLQIIETTKKLKKERKKEMERERIV